LFHYGRSGKFIINHRINEFKNSRRPDMNTKWSKLGQMTVAAIFLVTGCGTQQDANETNRGRLQGYRTYGTTNESQVGIFRFANRNRGISTHIESQLNLYGVQGAKVLVIGDMVLVGFRQEPGNENQNRTPHSNTQQFGETNYNYWDLTNTETMIQSQLNVPAQVFTVSDPAALDAMERIRQNLKNQSAVQSQSLASDLQMVLQNALQVEGKQTQDVRQGQR
jgi:hypothetical protein